MSPSRYGDDFKVGEIYRTQALTVTESHVVSWAGLTGDFYPLHTDREYAANTQFGERLVHGPFVFALAVGLVALAGFGGDAAIAWLGVDGMRMLAPVRINDTLRVEVLIKETRPTSNPRKGVHIWQYTVLNQRDERVLVFDYQLLLHLRG